MIGNDIVDVKRFRELCKNQSFLNKYFTEKEREYIVGKRDGVETMAGIYSAKEAVLKAAGIGIGSGKLDLKDVEIIHDENGKPYVNKTEKITAVLLDGNANRHIFISISHTKEIATAVCMIV